MSSIEELLSLLRQDRIKFDELPYDTKLSLFVHLMHDYSIQESLNFIEDDKPDIKSMRATIPRNSEPCPYMGNFRRPIRSRKIDMDDNSTHTIHILEYKH